VSRDLQHRLHTQLRTAVAFLDLPLGALDIEALAVEMTAPVKAMLAEALATADEQAPLAVSVPGPEAWSGSTPGIDEAVGVATTEYAGCIARIQVDVDLDSPAAVLAQWMRRQPEVVATDVPTTDYVGVILHPQSLTQWAWWLQKLSVTPDQVTVQGEAAYATGHRDGVTVQVEGDGVPDLLTDREAARLVGALPEHPW
jgi:hypothetical protein